MSDKKYRAMVVDLYGATMHFQERDPDEEHPHRERLMTLWGEDPEGCADYKDWMTLIYDEIWVIEKTSGIDIECIDHVDKEPNVGLLEHTGYSYVGPYTAYKGAYMDDNQSKPYNRSIREWVIDMLAWIKRLDFDRYQSYRVFELNVAKAGSYAEALEKNKELKVISRWSEGWLAEAAYFSFSKNGFLMDFKEWSKDVLSGSLDLSILQMRMVGPVALKDLKQALGKVSNG